MSAVRVACAAVDFAQSPGYSLRSSSGAVQARLWGRSSAGRALESHSRGRGFDSPRLHLRFCWVSALTAQPRPLTQVYSARSLRVPATRGVTLAAASARWTLA